MRISEILREDLILPELAATDKVGVLGEIAAGISRAHPQLAAARLAEVLVERERLGSTGIGDGVAIPHGKLAGPGGLIAALARSRAGVDFSALDGRPTHLFFALFAPESSPGLHLKALARVSRLFKQPELRRALLEAPGPAAIYRLVLEEDARE